MTSFLFVLASIMGFCLETTYTKQEIKDNSTNCTKASKSVSNTVHLVYLDYVCTAFFTLELVVRIIFAPSKKSFFTSPMNIIDIMAILPLYVQLILILTEREDSCIETHSAIVDTILLLRIIRICRIFHLVKHYKALKILVHAIKASIQELLMLMIFLIIGMLVFSTLIYYAEQIGLDKKNDQTINQFTTIPIGFWWAIITMTTVGYGDVYPSSSPGKTSLIAGVVDLLLLSTGCVIGALCAVTGVLLVALTIPVISNNFALFYMHARTRENIIKKVSQEACL